MRVGGVGGVRDEGLRGGQGGGVRVVLAVGGVGGVRRAVAVRLDGLARLAVALGGGGRGRGLRLGGSVLHERGGDVVGEDGRGEVRGGEGEGRGPGAGGHVAVGAGYSLGTASVRYGRRGGRARREHRGETRRVLVPEAKKKMRVEVQDGLRCGLGAGPKLSWRGKRGLAPPWLSDAAMMYGWRSRMGGFFDGF